jgi:two-component system nitrogen regulation response regulator NtrX
VKGAFTGATVAKRGKFELADGATLFLDEVGDMSQRVQAKVLRVLEEQRFAPVGSGPLVNVDVRVIAATNKHLDLEIERGNFRADLFYRLNVIPFEITPLRDRIADVPLLVEHFNQRFSLAYGKQPKRFEPDALAALMAYQWPGNVRELRNTVERVVIMHGRARVGAGDLPPLGGEAPALTPSKFSSFKAASEAHQREFIKLKLGEAEGNVTRAAELLGMDRSHLYRRMRALGIKIRE